MTRWGCGGGGMKRHVILTRLVNRHPMRVRFEELLTSGPSPCSVGAPAMTSTLPRRPSVDTRRRQ
jgi:hypothetical protein